MPTFTRHPVAVFVAEAGEMTQGTYSEIWRPDGRCVMTDMFINWLPGTLDSDIMAFLTKGPPSVLGPPPPNYRIYYGLNGGSTKPFYYLFQPPRFLERTQLPSMEPVSMPFPLVPPDVFEVTLKGTSVKVEARFGCEVVIETRPFNT